MGDHGVKCNVLVETKVFFNLNVKLAYLIFTFAFPPSLVRLIFNGKMYQFSLIKRLLSFASCLGSRPLRNVRRWSSSILLDASQWEISSAVRRLTYYTPGIPAS